MSAITWLHLSDLHLGGTESTVDRRLFDKMLADIQKQVCSNGLTLDAVFFTGDLTFSGQEKQYQLATKMLDEVLCACDLTDQRDKVFIVPGNHDVNRNAITPGIKSYFKDLLDPREEADGKDEYDCINTFLRNDEERASFFKGLQNFSRFVRDFYVTYDITFDDNDYYSVRPIKKDGYTIVVTGLNSAWLSHDKNEQGRLLLGEQQVCDAEKKGREKYPEACLHVVLVHHPIYWLAEKDVHRVRQHLPGLCDLLLRGHLHCPSYFMQRTPDWCMHEFAAGASWRTAWHAYNLVKLNLDSGIGSAIVRFQHPQLSIEWRPDTFTYRHARQGRIRWKVKLRK